MKIFSIFQSITIALLAASLFGCGGDSGNAATAHQAVQAALSTTIASLAQGL